MKITAQEEYGLRCLLAIARATGIITISEIAAAEALSPAYVARLLTHLRRAGLVRSSRGAAGGHVLARPAGEIDLAAALDALGPPLYWTAFCARHAGARAECVHLPDCSIRSIWRGVESAIRTALSRVKLADLLESEELLQVRAPLRAQGTDWGATPRTEGGARS